MQAYTVLGAGKGADAGEDSSNDSCPCEEHKDEKNSSVYLVRSNTSSICRYQSLHDSQNKTKNILPLPKI
jgi:hypothetical protein